MRLSFCFLVLIALPIITGCSGNQSPVSIDQTTEQAASATNSGGNRTVWGFWEIKIPSVDAPVEIVPNREVALHFNVIRMLEVEPCTDCLTIHNLTFMPDNIIQCNLRIRHPYPDDERLTGFDVRGIFISDGETYFPQSDRFVSYDGTHPRFINPDGYTALFNPTEFPEGSAPLPALAYITGKYAMGGNLSATLNPFVAYGIDNPRRMFGVGSEETRTIQVQFLETPIEFGYAVDVSWFPVDDDVDPVDFPPEANCLEPYRLEMTLLGVVEEYSGSLAPVQVEVFDHQGNDTVDTVALECPDLFENEILLDFSSQTGDESWMYTGMVENAFGAIPGVYPVLVKAVSSDQDANLGELAAYQVGKISVYPTDSGNLMWAKSAGSTWQYERPNAVTTLSDNSTVITGFFENPTTFGEGEPNETILEPEGPWDIFIARYRADGSLEWAKRVGGIDADNGYGITTLSDDTFVVTGYFRDSVIFGEGEPNETTLSAIDWECFIARYNPDTTLVWAKRAGGSQGAASGASATTLSDDSTVVTGILWGQVTFGEGEPNETTLVASINGDIFIARYNPDGTLEWAKHTIETCNNVLFTNESISIAELTDDSTVITGKFLESITFGEGEPNETTLNTASVEDIFIARYNPDGTLAWAKRAGGMNSDYAYGISVLSDDSVVVTGSFKDLIIFGESEPNETHLNSQNYRSFIACYNQDGTLAWAKSTGGNRGSGITTLSDDTYVVIGRLSGEDIFGEGEPNETILDSGGGIFIARYNPDGTLMWAKGTGGTRVDRGHQITALSDNSTVITGYFSYSAILGEGEPNETILDSMGAEDIFVARFTP